MGTPPAHPPFAVAEAEQLVEMVGHGSAGWLEATQHLEAHVGVESKLTSPSTVTAVAVEEDVTEAAGRKEDYSQASLEWGLREDVFDQCGCRGLHGCDCRSIRCGESEGRI